jgi:ABC-type glycerol-3-phosphate transport system permease component
MSTLVPSRQAIGPTSIPKPPTARTVRSVLIHLLVAAGSVSFAIPLVWMISISFMNKQQAFSFPPEWIPNPVVLSNFSYGFVFFDFILFFRNTLIICALIIVGTVVSSTIVAFSFARLRFRGRDTLFILLLATLMLPQQVTMIPQYVWFVRLGMVNSFVPLILPTFFGHPFNIFLLRQFFRTLPADLDDAAKIDGSGYLGILFRICLPLSKPAIGIVAIFAFVANWNDFQLPLIYLQKRELWTVAIGLLLFKDAAQAGGVNVPALMAMSVIVTLPLIALFFVTQRYFVQGVVMTGLKG